MQQDIRNKLVKLINGNSLSEADIVYLLVQISKCIDRCKVENKKCSKVKIPCIKFFRNWAVHGDLDQRQYYVKNILKIYEEIGAERLYDKLFNDLVEEINSVDIVNISCDLHEQFRKNLFEVIKDIPVTDKENGKKIEAKNPYKIEILNFKITLSHETPPSQTQKTFRNNPCYNYAYDSSRFLVGNVKFFRSRKLV